MKRQHLRESQCRQARCRFLRRCAVHWGNECVRLGGRKVPRLNLRTLDSRPGEIRVLRRPWWLPEPREEEKKDGGHARWHVRAGENLSTATVGVLGEMCRLAKEHYIGHGEEASRDGPVLARGACGD